MNGYLVVMNEAAGSADRAVIDAAVAVLAGVAPVDVQATGSLDDLARVVAGAGDRVVVAAGGDGTVHAVVRTLREGGQLGATAVGLVPLGTGNDLARTLGLPLEPVAAARCLAGGRPRRLDLLVDDAGGIVCNAVHAGIGADAAERAAPWKRWLGPLAYPLAAAVTGWQAAGWPVTVTVDGDEVFSGERALLVAIGNGRTIGGGTPLCTDADPADGLADVVVAADCALADRIRLGLALRRGDHGRLDGVTTARGRQVTVQGRGSGVGINADGELATAETRTWRVEHRAWSVIC